jgi:hypothetical protein
MYGFAAKERKKNQAKFDAQPGNKPSLEAVGYVRKRTMVAKPEKTEKQPAEAEPRADEWLERYVRDLHRGEDDPERDARKRTIDDDDKKERAPLANAAIE